MQICEPIETPIGKGNALAWTRSGILEEKEKIAQVIYASIWVTSFTLRSVLDLTFVMQLG